MGVWGFLTEVVEDGERDEEGDSGKGDRKMLVDVDKDELSNVIVEV